MDKAIGSFTAIGAAIQRAAHQLIDGDEKLLDDPVILRLFDPATKDHLIDRRHDLFLPGVAGLRSHIILRSRYAEDCLEQAYINGVRQFLILGAGLDTFAYRRPSWATDLKIIEADHPASQADKLQRLKEAGIAIPENVLFVEVDLEADDLASLFRNKIDFKKPVFTACLGVLIYLTQETVDKVFRFLGTFVVKSEFVFTASQKRNDLWAGIIADKVTRSGEPWLTYFEPDKLAEQLESYGFSEIHFLAAEEANKLYFEGKDTNLPAPVKSSIVKAAI